MVADLAPVVVSGANFGCTVQPTPAVINCKSQRSVTMPKSAASVPVIGSIWNCSVLPPAGDENTTGSGAENAPTAVDGKVASAGATVGNAIVAIPVLLTGIEKLPPDVSSVKVAVSGPRIVGVKLKIKSHDPNARMVPVMQLGT